MDPTDNNGTTLVLCVSCFSRGHLRAFAEFRGFPDVGFGLKPFGFACPLGPCRSPVFYTCWFLSSRRRGRVFSCSLRKLGKRQVRAWFRPRLNSGCTSGAWWSLCDCDKAQPLHQQIWQLSSHEDCGLTVHVDPHAWPHVAGSCCRVRRGVVATSSDASGGACFDIRWLFLLLALSKPQVCKLLTVMLKYDFASL